MRCLLGPFGCLLDNDNNDDPLYIYLSFKKSIYFRYALVLWIVLTAGRRDPSVSVPLRYAFVG